MAKRSLKIAIIIEHVHRRGGQERVIAELITRLSRRHQIDLFCFSAGDIPTDKVRIRRLWCPWRSNTMQAIWIVILSSLVVRPRKYDVVLSQGGNCLVQNFVLVHICHALRAKALREVTSPYQSASTLRRWLLSLRESWAGWMESRAVRRCRGRVMAVSQVLADYMVAQHGLKPSQVFTVANGVDHCNFHPGLAAEFRQTVRQQLGLSDDDFVILFVGGRWFDKGLPFLIEALRLMNSSQGRLIVVGEGDTKLFAKIAAHNEVRSRVVFVPPTKEIVKYYGAADCFAFPSRAEVEGFPLVIIEAAASGVPLVLGPVGGADELVEDGVSGFLANCDPAVIAEKLDTLAADPQFRQRMGQAAHQKSLALSWDRQAEQIEQIFLSKLPEPDRHGEQKAASPPSSLRNGKGSGVRSSEARPDAGTTRVAAVSHSCVVSMNQQLYVELTRYDDVELKLVTPCHWWASLSGRITTSVLPELDDAMVTLPVWLPGQIHLHWYRCRLHRTLKDFAPDILYVDEEPYSVAGAQGAYLAKRLGCKFIVSTKENLVRNYPLPLQWTYKWVLGQADHILAISEEGKAVVRRQGYQGPVTVLAHGIDPEAFCPAPEAARRQRKRLGLAGPVVGYVGRLATEKGVMDLVEAVKIARKEHNLDLSLLLVGEGRLRKRLEQTGREFLGPNRLAVTGHIPHHQIPEYMNALDMLVLPSRTTDRWKEQFGRVLIEALGCRVPVIGSDSGHIPDLIEDTGGGLIFREGDPTDLAEKIQQLVENPGEAQALAQQGRQRVLEKYTWSQTARQLHQVLQQVASGQIP